jgi:hypothetical protein
LERALRDAGTDISYTADFRRFGPLLHGSGRA